MAVGGRGSWLLLALLLVAVGGGIAATVLATAPSHAPNQAPATEVILPFWIVALPVLGLFVAFVVILLAQRATGPTAMVPNQIVLSILIGILLLIGFVVLSHFLGGSQVTSGGTSSGTNTTTNSTPPTNSSGTINGTGGTLSFWTFPPWAGDVLLFVLVGAFVAAVGGSLLGRRLGSSGRSRGPSPPSSAAARSALVQAESALADGADPRSTILALYGRLLSRVSSMVGDVEVATPEEIRIQHLVHLGVGPHDAEDLTRLFEEARYSTHPMGAEAADRAQRAIRAALRDLDRRGPPA